jgi:hypothetical protein
MKLYAKKERDGWAVYLGEDALVRGLREKRDAHRIRYDVARKGFFKGTVIFARNGRALDIVVPADANLSPGREEPLPPWLVQRTQRDEEGSVDEL